MYYGKACDCVVSHSLKKQKAQLMGKPPAGDLLTAICNVNKIPGSAVAGR